jgi:hypothetical protein
VRSIIQSIGVVVLIALASVILGTASAGVVGLLDLAISQKELTQLFAGLYTFLGAFYYLTK